MDDDELIEAAISQELSKLNENITDPESDTPSEDISDDDQVIHEIPESVLSCFQLERDRLNLIERLIMEESKEKESTKDYICGEVPNNCEEFLKELASECGEDPIKLKKRILCEIEEEESQSTLCTIDPQTASKGNETENMPCKDGDPDEYIETEHKFRGELIDLEKRLKVEEKRRILENKVMKEHHLKMHKEEEERRMRRHRFFEEELKKIEQDNTFHQHLSLNENNCKINGKISLELSKQQELIAGLQKHVVEERQALEAAQAEQGRKSDETRCRAATKIQASVRAFLVRTKNAMALNERLEERRQMREVHLRLERERKGRQEKLRRKLEEQRIKQEEERRGKEEERIRQKEERTRKKEERRREEEERIRRREERRREEEERRREEEERIRLKEERRREEEERKREEEERIRLKEERRREEEERVRQEEEKKRKEEERRREEEERVRQEEEKKRKEEERRKKEEEDRREHERRCAAQERAKEEDARLERERKQKEEEARKDKEEEIQKQEELVRKKRIEEEECRQREMEEREAEELRKQEEEENRRQEGQERNRMEESQNQEEKQIPEEKQNPHCSYGESETEAILASNPQPTSEELARAKIGQEIDDAMSDQSDEERCAWRLKRFYQSSQSSCSSGPDEAGGAGGQQGERPAFLLSDRAVAELLSDPKRLGRAKDFVPWTGQNQRAPALESTVVRRGSEGFGPAPGTGSVVQSASWNSNSEELSARLLDPENEGKAVEMETRARIQAFLMGRNKERQLQVEEERKEKEERVRKRAEEQRREVERAHLEREFRMEEEEEEEEEKQQSEMGEGKGEDLREQEDRDRRRKEESQNQWEEPILRVKQSPCRSAVRAEKDPQSTSGELSQAKRQGSEGDIAEAGTGQSEGEGLRQELPSSGPMCLPDSTEQKRLAWMKDCVSWTKLSLQNKRKPGVKSKTVRRGSVMALPPLSTDAILQGAACNSLKQVTTVTLEDLPGCSLSAMSECTRLQALTMRRCGLVALEGLSGCKGLRHIDLQENAIRFVNCQDLTKLRVLLLSQNQLTSIHGLEDAVDLDVLELSHNRISRISGLESLKRLQRLLLDHNQLISTRGLSELYTLLYLDCGSNHLTSMNDLENCALLNTLNLEGNNLTEAPTLKNHVLMRELRLDDNVLSSLDSLSACWLPLLQLISASKNSITHLPPLSDCVSLQKLDISHNCLSELENIGQSLKGCSQLQEIQLLGNPFQQESNWRSSLLQTVPELRRINGEWIGSTAPLAGRAGSPPPGSFLCLCRAQLQQLEKVRRRHETQLSTPCRLDVPAVISRHCDESLQLAEEQRYAHEFGDLMVTDRAELDPPGIRTDQDALPAGAVGESNQETPSSAPCVSDLVPEPSAGAGGEDAGSGSAGATSDRCADPLTSEAKERPAPATPARKRVQKLDLKNMAAVVIQSFWRGHACRRDALLHAAGADRSGSSVATGTCLDRCRAATVIQAVWKGHVLRKRLASALAAVRITETDEEFAEVDMDEFAFDEAALDRDWTTLNSERPPSRMQPLRYPPPWPKPLAHQSTQQTCPSMLPWRPKQAWPGGESETTAHSAHRSVSPERIELTHRAKSPSACGFDLPDEKSDKIMKEWGLRDRFTARLMLKRAQKMKPKKKKDRKSGDPAVCLDLVRNDENKQTPVRVPGRNLPGKIQPFKDFFVAGKEDFDEQKRREWTSLWLQTQVNNTETDRSSLTTESHHFLPEIDHDVLSGRRVQLVSVSALPRCCQAGPGHRDGPDQESGSRASASALSPPRKEHNQTRGDTVGHAKKEAPVPVQAASGPSKKERISFRDNPVHLSQGWGGGKKRSKINK